MDGLQVLKIAVSFWGVMMAVSPALQIRRMIQTGESADVSIGYFAILTVGFLLWTAYGVSIDDAVLYGCNTIATVFGVATMVIALRLRRRQITAE